MDDLVQAMGGTGISKSQVSRLCEEIDDRVDAFLIRPIDGEWPCLWIDATCLKVRRGGRIVSVAVTIAVGANTGGRREVLGMAIGPSEAETFWTDFLRDLVRRGMSGVKLVISDAHEGIKAATARVLSTTWQCCRVHLQRDALAHAGKSSRRVVSAFIATAFDQPDHGAVSAQWRLVADQMRGKLPKLASLMDGAEEDVLPYMTFSQQHRAKLHGTNPIERLNGEIRRRTDVVGFEPSFGPVAVTPSLPNEAAIRRLAGASLMEQTEPWTVQRERYMTPETLAPVCNDLIVSLPAAHTD
ncbi:transposase [Oceanicola granulosus HTCC2516]|uniref:Mutator family transposase n=1 Tax=Oceanicola granulosus (strain ATCC BAA-861 / DSM 15982 / KCTC 12143 / HTCC2516) TaxID=314256 RepID=Q2CG14_OCEGH|nr:transposase [Oceanicola granulosus HTCC2516]